MSYQITQALTLLLLWAVSDVAAIPREQRTAEWQANRPAPSGRDFPEYVPTIGSEERIAADKDVRVQPRTRREAPELPTNSCSEAVDEVIAFHAGHLRDNPRVIDLPDMRRETSQTMLFVTITTVMKVHGVQLRLPVSLRRLSPVTTKRNDAERGGGADFEFNVGLGRMITWGKFDVQVAGVGPSGDYRAQVDDRIIRATVRYEELPANSSSEGGKCRLQTQRLQIAQRGKYHVVDLPPVFASWGAEVEDVAVTLEVMRNLLNAELPNFPCDERFTRLVRSCLDGDAADVITEATRSSA